MDIYYIWIHEITSIIKKSFLFINAMSLLANACLFAMDPPAELPFKWYERALKCLNHQSGFIINESDDLSICGVIFDVEQNINEFIEDINLKNLKQLSIGCCTVRNGRSSDLLCKFMSFFKDSLFKYLSITSREPWSEKDIFFLMDAILDYKNLERFFIDLKIETEKSLKTFERIALYGDMKAGRSLRKLAATLCRGK